jgi:hypothetical protein
MVIGAFHDPHGQPMTRPFQLIDIAANDRRVVSWNAPVTSV